MVGYSCAETGTHSANCAADRRDSPVAALGPVLDMPVIVQRHTIQKTIEILQLQFIDKVVDVCCAGSASSSGAGGEEMVEIPQLQPVKHGHCRSHARRCAMTAAGGSDGRKLRRSPSCSTSQRGRCSCCAGRHLGSSILGQGSLTCPLCQQ